MLCLVGRRQLQDEIERFGMASLYGVCLRPFDRWRS